MPKPIVSLTNDIFQNPDFFSSFLQSFAPWRVGHLQRTDNSYKSILSGVDSLVNKWTGAGLTGEQEAMNAFNAQQAQEARAFGEMQRQTNYQTAVRDMQAAGLNPAMMYGGGNGGAASSTSAPAASAASGANGARLSELIELLTLPATLRNINAQADLTKSQANLNKIDANYRATINEAQIRSTTANADNLIQAIEESKSRVRINGKEMDVKDAQIALFGSQVSLNEARTLTENSQRFLNECNAEQVRKLTPVLVGLNRANTYLAQARTLTEAEQQHYLRAQSMYTQKLAELVEYDKDLKSSMSSLYGAEFVEKDLHNAALGKLNDATNSKWMLREYRSNIRGNYVNMGTSIIRARNDTKRTNGDAVRVASALASQLK